MLGSTPLAAVLGSAPPPDAPAARLKSFVKAAADQGLAILLCAPGTKIPVDVRSPVQRRKDDEAAQDAAREAGRYDWAKARSLAGAHLATTDPTLLGRYIDRYRKLHGDDAPINFAIEVGRSRLVVVDCDTTEQRQAFLTDAGITDTVPPTVTSPGAKDHETGEWAHYDGGHFYFTVPAGTALPAETGTWTAAGGYAVLWRDRYVLIPPSVRPEGAYTLTGREYDVPEWLLERMGDHAARRVRAHTHHGEGLELGDAIDTWAENVEWTDILAPAGWTLTARPDRCGCDVWTAPGTHHSPKSATTHDSGCQLGRYTEVNAPMHVWTDNPGEEFEAWIAAHGGSKTLSKLQAVAVTTYGGDVGTACAEMGVLPSKDSLALDLGVSASNLLGDLDLPPASEDEAEADRPGPAPCPHMSVSAIGRCFSCGAVVGDRPETAASAQAETTPDLFAAPAGQNTPEPTSGDTAVADGTFPDEGGEPEPVEDETILNAESNGVPKIAPFDYWRDLPAPEYAIEGLVEHRALSCLIGPPGVGKSAVAIDMACSLVTGIRWQGRKTMRQRVLYLPGEGSSGAVERIKAWEEAHGLNVGQDLLMGDAIIQLAATKEDWATLAGYLLRQRVGLIIFDTFARMSLGLEENSASDVGRAVLRFDQIRKLTGAGVMVVHHTGKVGTSGRGSNALLGALDSEMLVTVGQWDASAFGDGYEPIELTTTKQKNAARLRDPIPLMLTPHRTSVIVTGPSGKIGDPLDNVTVAPLLVPEPVIETAIRLQEYAQRFTEQGVTRGDLVVGVQMDDYCAARKNPEIRWKQHVYEAVDLGLKTGLLETLTGKATGARYLASVATADQARRQVAGDAMGGQD